MSAPCLLIAGAGDLGARLALLRADCGDEVIPLRRLIHAVEHQHVEVDVA